MRYAFFTFCIGLFFVQKTTAQTTFSGKVTDGLTGETLIGATVEAVESRRGLTTNEYGFFSITVLSETLLDSVSLRVSYIGYDSRLLRFKSGGSFEKLKIELQPTGATTSEVVVSAKATELEDKLRSTEMSTMTLETREIKQIPLVFGEADILKALQLKPGITPGTEGSTGLFVRGGGGDQNLIVLDEAVVYNASHLFGFFSTFNADALKDLKIYKGGFPAQYGGRLSSVLDVRMKEGNNKFYQAEGGLGLIASRLTIEGPIQKEKSSFIVSARRTYADIITRSINNANDGKVDYNPIPDYYFYDLNTKVNVQLTEKDHLFLSGYFGRDKFGFNNETFNFDFDWGNATGTARWNHLFGPKLFSNATFTFSDYRYLIANQIVGFQFRTDSNIKDASGKVDFYWSPNEKHVVRFGAGATNHQFVVGRLKAGSDDGRVSFEAGQNFTGDEFWGYVADEWAATSRLKLLWGGRVSAFSNDPAFYGGFEPRLAANFSATKKLNLKASYARMKQYVHLVANSGVSLPTDIWYPSTAGVKPQTSDQIAAGYSYLLGKKILITNEIYYKWLQNSLDFKDGANLFANDELEKEFAFGKGRAYGLEIEIEKKSGKLTGWIGWQWSKTERGEFPTINNGAYFPTPYDTRHVINVVAMYRLNRRLSLSGTTSFQSGYARWLSSGRFTFQGTAGEQFQAVVPVYGPRNTFRMPYYLRVDAGLVWKFFPKWGESDLTLSIYNATDRRNPFFIYLEPVFETLQTPAGEAEVPTAIKAKQVTLFPILPTVTWNFKIGKGYRK